MITIEESLIFLLISVGICFLYAIIYMRRISINDKKRVELEEFNSISTNFNAEGVLINTLDNLIQSVFDNYVLVEIEANTTFKETKTIETDVTKAVSDRVMSMISPTLLNSLTMIYHKDKIGKLISDRTYMQVFAYFASKKAKL